METGSIVNDNEFDTMSRRDMDGFPLVENGYDLINYLRSTNSL